MKNRSIRFVNRHYRTVKTWLLVRQPPVLTRAFFLLLAAADLVMTSRRRPGNGEDRKRPDPFPGRPETRFRLLTDHPVALRSDDHRFPRGTIRDNSTNDRFNRRLEEFFHGRRPLSLLDLGCSGGGFVRSLLEQGHVAIGLEGSDASFRLQSGEWSVIPHHLFTCDIVRPFRLECPAGTPARFDVVTAWEVIEHVAEDDLPQLILNIRNHLRPGGIFVCSIDLLPDGNPVLGAVYHRTVKPAGWWIETFRRHGLAPVERHPFLPEDMVRGNGGSLKDWHPDDGHGIHLVLKAQVHEEKA